MESLCRTEERVVPARCSIRSVPPAAGAKVDLLAQGDLDTVALGRGALAKLAVEVFGHEVVHDVALHAPQLVRAGAVSEVRGP
eukprot:5444845-Prymnesium_polylepis.2